MIYEIKHWFLGLEGRVKTASKQHPYGTMLAFMVGLPLLFVLAITTISAGIMLPILWVCGCL